MLAEYELYWNDVCENERSLRYQSLTQCTHAALVLDEYVYVSAFYDMLSQIVHCEGRRCRFMDMDLTTLVVWYGPTCLAALVLAGMLGFLNITSQQAHAYHLPISRT